MFRMRIGFLVIGVVMTGHALAWSGSPAISAQSDKAINNMRLGTIGTLRDSSLPEAASWARMAAAVLLAIGAAACADARKPARVTT